MKSEIKKGSLIKIVNPKLSWRKKFKGSFGEVREVFQDLNGDPVFVIWIIHPETSFPIRMTLYVGEIRLADKADRFLHVMDRKLIFKD